MYGIARQRGRGGRDMFRELINEAKLSVLLHTTSPLTIRSAQGKLLDPTLLDMQCVKSRYHGRDTVIIPGSSLKGVIRSRYEKIISLFGGECCNIFNKESRCNGKIKSKKSIPYEEQGKYVYQYVCPVCRLFGSLNIGSRIYIADAYPIGDCTLGERTGVGINRITGAAQKSALYDFEVVEDGTFRVEITLKNYELYQMVLLLYVLKDLDEGYVSLGAATTRGNGRMEVQKLDICFRDYRKEVRGWKGAQDPQEIPLYEKYQAEYEWKVPFFGEIALHNLSIDEMITNCSGVDVQKKLEEENVRETNFFKG